MQKFEHLRSSRMRIKEVFSKIHDQTQLSNSKYDLFIFKSKTVWF